MYYGGNKMINLKKIFSLILGFLIIISTLGAQENDSDNTIAIDESEIVYVIRGFDFDIAGRTKPHYLELYGEFREGDRIQGKENFDSYLARRTQVLNNQRVLDDTATQIEYFLGDPEDDGAIPVRLLVHVKDAMNFIIVPYPKYDSNDGFSITLKARDYNFLGTMNTLAIDLGYKLDNNNKSIFSFSIDSDTPFQAFGLDWNLNFDNSFSLTIGEPLYYENVTGLSVNIPTGSIVTTIGFNHYLTINEKSVSTLAYGSTELFASWRIPLGIEVGDFGGLYYSPRVSGRISYPYSRMDNTRKPVTTLGHSLGFGRVDWIGNLRKGLSASIGNSNSWYFGRSDNAPLSIRLDVDAAFYWAFNNIIGLTSRLKYRQLWHWSGKENNWYHISSAGDYLRGVPNNALSAEYMLSLSLDLPVRVLRFWPSEWFNKEGLRFFNFEMYFSPFIDLAMVKGSLNDSAITFSFDNMIKTTGLEVIVFPGIIRSIQIRGSLGFNIDTLRKDGLSLKWGFFPQWHEIYIGIDLFY
jgi:outer membrane protein assembly factor BamA